MVWEKVLLLFQEKKFNEGFVLLEQQHDLETLFEERYSSLFELLKLEGTFQDQIQQAFSTTEFDLSYKKIKKLAPAIGDFVHLNKIDLTNNRLAKLPLEFSNLIHLEDLSLGDNNIGKFPRVILNLKKLTRLDLSYNQLTIFPVQEVVFEALKCINLSSNKIEEFPSIFESKQLEIIDISSNKFNSFPCFFENLNLLKELMISNNSFTSIPTNIFNNPSLIFFEAIEMDLRNYAQTHCILLQNRLKQGTQICLDDEDWKYEIKTPKTTKTTKTPSITPINNSSNNSSNPEKQAIDNELLSIIKATGCTDEEYQNIQNILSNIQPQESLALYLKEQAIEALEFFFNRHDIKSFLEKKLKRTHYIDFLVLNDGCMYMDFNDEYIEYYPEESHEFLEQENFFSISGADVVGWWETATGTIYCHAHMEGFWILAETPFDFIHKIAKAMK